MAFFRSSKVSSFVLPCIFILLISFAIMTAITYVEKHAKQSIHKSLFTVLQITQEALERWADNHLQDLVDIADDQAVLSFTNKMYDSDSINQQLLINHDFKRFMSQKVRRYADQTFLVISPKGVNLASKYNSDLGKVNPVYQHHNEEFSKIFAGHTLFIPPVNYPMDDQHSDQSAHLDERMFVPTVFVGAPIYNHDAKVVAALIMGFNPLIHFTRITELGRIGRTGETYGFNKSGLLVTKSRFTQNLKLLGMLGEKDMAMLSIRITDPGVNLVEGLTPKLDQASRPLTLMASRALKHDELPYYDAYRDYRGVPVFGAWLWSEALGIGLATEIDEDEALESFYVTRFVFLCVLAVIILLIMGLAFLPLWFKERERDALKKHQKNLEKKVQDRTEQLEQANYKLKVLSELDPLTRIANRRLYNRTLIKEIAMAKRTSEPLSLLVFDIDDFKKYNDNYGHDNGDVILQEVAKILTNSITRTTDFVARYGGEEFVAILPATDEKGAFLVAERVRINIEAENLEHIHSSVLPCVTVSVGIATLKGAQLCKKELFQQADLALYKAKEGGRNQVITYRLDKTG